MGVLVWFALVWFGLFQREKVGRKKVHELIGENVRKPRKNMTNFKIKMLYERQSEITAGPVAQRERGNEARELECGVEKGLYISLAHQVLSA